MKQVPLTPVSPGVCLNPAATPRPPQDPLCDITADPPISGDRIQAIAVSSVVVAYAVVSDHALTQIAAAGTGSAGAVLTQLTRRLS
jgi:hypothetical protein